jgi:GR25 family glycosyltransferase involved in LPS biosynthesis
MKLEDIDMPIVIKLAKRPERWQRISNDIEALGLPFKITRYEGVDGAAIGKPPWYVPTKCVYACCNVIKDAISRGAKYLWVMEDDCIFCDSFLEKF